MTQSNKRMHATRDTRDVIKRNLAGGRVMRGVRLLLRLEITIGWMRESGGWRSELIEASPAVMTGLTSAEAGGGWHGAGRR
jgi:hypothetical protein